MLHKGNVRQGKFEIDWEYNDSKNRGDFMVTSRNHGWGNSGTADRLVMRPFELGRNLIDERMYRTGKLHFKVGIILGSELWQFLSPKTRKRVEGTQLALKKSSNWDEFIRLIDEFENESDTELSAITSID